MSRYFLSALIFFMSITLSVAIPPALEELIEGLEKSLVMPHPRNIDIYSEQLARLMIDGQTVLTDQAAEDKKLIPIYYGTNYRNYHGTVRKFVDKPINILKPIPLPMAAEEQLALEEPFDHIRIHNYGFGVFCDQVEEEKIVRGIGALAISYKMRRNPAILQILKDVSNDASLGEDVVNHRKLVRGIFSHFSGEDLQTDRSDMITNSVSKIITVNNGHRYMVHLKSLMDNCVSQAFKVFSFDMSPYSNYYLTNALPLPDNLAKAKESFTWIDKVVSPEVLSKSLQPLMLSIPQRSTEKIKILNSSQTSKGVIKPSDAPDRNITDNEAAAASKSNLVSNDAKDFEAALIASEESFDNVENENKEEGDEEFVAVDNDYLSDESYGMASTEATPHRPIPRISDPQDIYASIVSSSSSDSLSSIGNSPVRVVGTDEDF